MDSTNQKRLPANAHAHRDVFQARLPRQDNGEVKQRQRFCNHGDTICHPNSCYVTGKHDRTSTRRCNNNAIFSDSYFQDSCRLRIPPMLIWPQRSLGSSCQTIKMAALLKSLFFVFKISFLPKYRVIYYDCCKVMQWDICNWCVSLDIS